MSSWTNRKCIKCGATTRDGSFAFHRFPKPGTTNILRATAWATYCWPEKDWSSVEALTALHTNSKVLCGRHFEDCCYTNSNRRRLSAHAVPGSKEYIIRLLHSLRSKIPSIVNKVCSQSSPRASSSMEIFTSAFQQPESQAELPISTDPPSQDNNEPGYATHPVIPADILTPPPAGASTEPTTSANTGIGNIKKKRNGILKKIDKSRISELTPTEQRLYKICINKINRITKIKKQFKGKAKIDKIKNICDNECVKNLFELKLSNPCILLLQSQVINCQRKKQGRRYSLEQKIMALTLYKKSPACYRLLRQMFSLPCPSSLNSLLNKVPMKPGINAQVFNGLKAMAETLTDDQKLCVLSFDEMAIRKHLQYNTQTDSVDGFQDHGEHGRTGQVACNALVFMVCGLRSNWKQPIAYYLNGKSSFSDRLSVTIKEVLSECIKSGLNVVSTVCDMCSVNLKALRALGATTESPHFVHDGREIVTIADPPHLLKCLRNLFMSYNVEYPTEIHPNGKITTGTAKWDHVKQFYDLDKINPHFVYAPVLTDKHISPNAKQKMRVKLAAQVFSHTVSAGILAKVAVGELPSEAVTTASFLKQFDGLFDALNANSPDLRRGKKFSCNMTARSPHLQYFESMKKIIKEMKFVNARHAPSQSGWVQTLNAVERLWKNLKELGIQSLSTRRLNQDPLENFFGCVRYNCGSNYNPTISQFSAGFKAAIISNLRHTIKNKNCEDDDGVLSNNFKSFLLTPIDNKEKFTPSEIPDTPQTTDGTDAELEAISSELQACAYVCGFIVKKINNGCDTCIQLLTSSPGSEPAHVFTQFKEYDDQISRLNYSSQNLIKAVDKTAGVTKTYLENNLHCQNLQKNGILLLRSECKEDLNFLQTCAEHYETNFNDILFHAFKICLKRFIILRNREFSEEASKRALQRKITILKNK